MMDRARRRGQVLPVWIVAIFAALTLSYFAMNFASALRAQIKVQNAADAAAQAAISLQTQQFNLLTSALYATNVEEFRVRSLLQSIMYVVNNSGPCSSGSDGPPFTPTTNCQNDYTALVSAYHDAVVRYGQDVQVVNDISGKATYTNWSADAATLVHSYMPVQGVCNDAATTITTVHVAGSNCGISLTLLATQTRTPLYNAEYMTNAQPLEATCSQVTALSILPPGLSCNNPSQNLSPPEVDVVACMVVDPIVPSFGIFQSHPYYAIARAAATAVPFEQEWFQPGGLTDNWTGQAFQAQEDFGGTPPVSSDSDWNGVYYGDQPWVAANPVVPTTAPTGGDVFYFQLNNNVRYSPELSVYTNFWNAVPIRPFAAAPLTSSVCPPLT